MEAPAASGAVRGRVRVGLEPDVHHYPGGNGMVYDASAV